MKPRPIFAACILALTAAFGALSSTARAQSPQYVVTDLGTLGGTSSAAFSINDSGQITGGSDTSGQITHAFFYSGGSMSVLGTTAEARAINNSDQIAGTSGGLAYLYTADALVTILYAAPSEPVYPPTERAFHELTFKRLAQSELPHGVFFWISNGAEENQDPKFEGNVCFIDINGDGTKEIIVESLCKHENQYEIWQKRKGRWISLLSVGGGPDFLRKRNGYYQVTVWRENRNTSTRELYAFEGERYHAIRIDEYENDLFVRSRDTHDREEVLENNFKVQFQK
jgi:probable HAF family extracellular repeat protein